MLRRFKHLDSVGQEPEACPSLLQADASKTIYDSEDIYG